MIHTTSSQAYYCNKLGNIITNELRRQMIGYCNTDSPSIHINLQAASFYNGCISQQNMLDSIQWVIDKLLRGLRAFDGQELLASIPMMIVVV